MILFLILWNYFKQIVEYDTYGNANLGNILVHDITYITWPKQLKLCEVPAVISITVVFSLVILCIALPWKEQRLLSIRVCRNVPQVKNYCKTFDSPKYNDNHVWKCSKYPTNSETSSRMTWQIWGWNWLQEVKPKQASSRETRSRHSYSL